MQDTTRERNGASQYHSDSLPLTDLIVIFRWMMMKKEDEDLRQTERGRTAQLLQVAESGDSREELQEERKREQMWWWHLNCWYMQDGSIFMLFTDQAAFLQSSVVHFRWEQCSLSFLLLADWRCPLVVWLSSAALWFHMCVQRCSSVDQWCNEWLVQVVLSRCVNSAFCDSTCSSFTRDELMNIRDITQIWLQICFPLFAPQQ